MSHENLTNSKKDISESSSISLLKSSATPSYELKAAPTTPSQHRKYVFIRDKVYSWLPAKIETPPSSSSSVPQDDSTVTVRLVLPSDWKDVTYHPPKSTLARLSSDSDCLLMRTVNLNDYPDFHLPLQNVDVNGTLKEQADTANMKYVNEASVLYNLRERHKRGLPYTRVGEIIVAMNPFEWFTDLYSKETELFYANKLIWKEEMAQVLSTSAIQLEGSNRVSYEPHVYETSSNAYCELALEQRNQSIMVSGESGSGKTESVKIIMKHLVNIQRTRSSPRMYRKTRTGRNIEAHNEGKDDDAQEEIVSKVLHSNPIIEAFGNAMTTRNDNSSRFGRLTKLYFMKEREDEASPETDQEESDQSHDDDDPANRVVPVYSLVGSSFETFLLEKARVVSHSKNERTFHIFYQLLSAPSAFKEELMEGFGSATRESFRYLRYADSETTDERTDAASFEQTTTALATFGVEGEELQTLMKALCIILQLGNLTFEPDPSVEGEGALIVADDELEKLLNLIGIGHEEIRKALTMRLVKARGEELEARLSPTQSRDSCNALAKEIYSQLVDVIVRKMNVMTRPMHSDGNANQLGGDADNQGDIGCISVLDLFGFESFKKNSFEQLCINYANEHLQNRYVLDNFQSVKDEYEFQGVGIDFDCSTINNSEILNLVEGRMGLISIMNEECVRPMGNDSSFVYKAKVIHKDSKHLVHERLHRPCEFGVEHFAGLVTYDATGFVGRNTDQLPLDLLECATKSTNTIIATQFDALLSERKQLMKNVRKKQGAMSMTICSKFRKRLAGLVKHLAETKTRYVRCVQPNEDKLPRVTDHMATMRQLGSAGIVTAINMSKRMFSNQLPYSTVWDRFQCLSRTDIDTQLDYKEKVVLLLSDLLKDEERFVEGHYTAPYVCGQTKVFFRTGALEKLESDRKSMRSFSAFKLHGFAKALVQRYKFRAMKRAAVKLQAGWRLQMAQKRHREKRRAAIVIYCWMKRFLFNIKRQNQRKNDASIKIQSAWRGFYPKEELKKQKKAAAMVQRAFRKNRDRHHFNCAFAECVEAARKQKQMKSLLQTLSSDHHQNTEDLLVQCQLMISYLGEQLHSQRAKTSETRDALELSKRRADSFQSRNRTLEAENKASEITASRQREEIKTLQGKLKEQQDLTSDAMKSIKLLQFEQKGLAEGHEKEKSEMEQRFLSEKKELHTELANEHAAEVSRLNKSMTDAEVKYQQDISDLHKTLEDTEESHEEDFEQMLSALEEGKVQQEELELTKESLQNENSNLRSDLQSSKLAHSKEVAKLNDDLEKLHGDLDLKEDAIKSLESQVNSLEEEKTALVTEQEEETGKVRNFLKSRCCVF